MSDVQERKPRILVIDDERVYLDILIAVLQHHYWVTAARNGQKAIEMALKNPPDLILLDILMPDMDGYEVCQQLKNHPKLNAIPVIFISAMHEEKEETKGLELGAVDYINKPIRPAIVQARVKNHLKLKQAYEELEEKNAELQEKNQVLQEMGQLREDVERMARHDLKTPLHGVIGFSSLLMEELELESTYQEMLRDINTCGYQMLEMINSSLDLYKMETGVYRYQAVKVDILSILRKLAVEMTELANSKHNEFKIVLNGQHLLDNNSVFIVIGEELLCYSMLANIVKNALETSPAHHVVTITLSTADNGMATICIHNVGVVPASIRNCFFDKYVTADKAGGTGLGTYSAKLIAQTLQGNIEMQTSVTEGTCITITLPGSTASAT